MVTTDLLFLVGKSPLLIGSGQKPLNNNCVLLPLSELPEDVKKIVRTFSPDSLQRSFPSPECVHAIDDVLRGNDFYEKFYSEKYRGFPLQGTGRLIALVEQDERAVSVSLSDQRFVTPQILEKLFPEVNVTHVG